MLKKWKLRQSHLVLNNQWSQVRRDEVELPDGTVIDDFFVNVRPDIALVVAVTSEDEVVFVRQYRHGVGQILLELPAGSFNPETETSEVAAVRELGEETGYVAEQLIRLATLYDSPVKDTNSVHLFLATNVVKKEEKIKLDVTEEIEVILIPFSQVREKIIEGEICVSGSISALFLALEFLSKNNNK
jgi:8-oxo-dGTP pyrophosphatase MutT (NUDIX family)